MDGYRRMIRGNNGIGLASAEGCSAYHVLDRFPWARSSFVRERKALQGTERHCGPQCYRSCVATTIATQRLGLPIGGGHGPPGSPPSLPYIDCCVPLACRLSSALISSTPLAYSSSWSMYICCLLQVSSRRAT